MYVRTDKCRDTDTSILTFLCHIQCLAEVLHPPSFPVPLCQSGVHPPEVLTRYLVQPISTVGVPLVSTSQLVEGLQVGEGIGQLSWGRGMCRVGHVGERHKKEGYVGVGHVREAI